MKFRFLPLFLVFFFVCFSGQGFKEPLGVVIDHLSKSTEKYIGSPAICVLPDGSYVASHDEFGPRSAEFYSAITHIFVSRDKGKTWQKTATLDGQFWSNLFVHQGMLYILGTNKHHGNIVIRKSTDGGLTWTQPYDATHGLIVEGEYHTAPTPVVVHNGRIWRAVEYATGKSSQWGKRYSAMMISAPVNADLLKAESWTKSNSLPYDSTYLDGKFEAWLEGNAVLTPDGHMEDILRIHAPNLPDEYCAVVNISKDGKKASFDSKDFYRMPGASKKFTIRFDPVTQKYLSLVNTIETGYEGKTSTDRIRNAVSLISSTDLRNWKIEQRLLFHEDYRLHAFQYIDWQFDGKDIVFVSRTASEDNNGDAHSAHDANYMTFHRADDFRTLISH